MVVTNKKLTLIINDLQTLVSKLTISVSQSKHAD